MAEVGNKPIELLVDAIEALTILLAHLPQEPQREILGIGHQ